MELSARTLVLVWVALMVLLAITIGATFVPVGTGFKTAVNLGVALTKAVLIFWFYMHLREETGLVRLAAVGAAAWLGIMLLLMSSDYLTRFWFGTAR
jgi:cytochrome c oxidase subunit 4